MADASRNSGRSIIVLNMKPYLIDSHSHLDDETFAPDLERVIRHAADENITIVTIGSDLESSRRAVEKAERFSNVYAAVGIHPSHAPSGRSGEESLDLGAFRELLAHPKVVAIGEVGLDFSDLPELRKGDPQRFVVEEIKIRQKALLSAFLEMSREARLPLLLQCREAHEDLLEMLENWNKMTPGFDARGILHGFNGGWNEARRYFNLGFLISITGVMSHGAHNVDVFRKAPATRLAVESDCPHMTSRLAWGFRRTEPSYLPTCLSAVAGLRHEKTEDLARQVTENVLDVLKKIPRN